jgi:HTH-type transcriptional regulator/antitoxin HigA
MTVAVKSEENKTKMRKKWIEVLMSLYPLYPIHNKKDYHRAVDAAGTLVGKNLNSIANKYLEVLTILIERYEKERYDIETGDITPRDVLEYLCSENNLSASDLGRILGDRSLGSKILNGQRDLSKSHIAKLSEHFSVDPSLFF